MGNECPHCQRRARELIEGERAWDALLANQPPRRATRNARTGHTVVQGRRAQNRLRGAVRQIITLLRLRRRWSEIGRYLQTPYIRDLTVGLERRSGTLVRTRPAPTGR